jgi:hypothetical protein
MDRGWRVAGSLFFLGACLIAGVLTGILIHRLVVGSPQEAILLLGVEANPDRGLEPPVLRAVWVAVPQTEPDQLHLIGLLPEVWDREGRLCDLYQQGADDRLRDVVAALLEEVDHVSGAIILNADSLSDLVELVGRLPVGSAPQDAQGALAYLRGASDSLDALDRQSWVLKGAVQALAAARPDPQDLSALLNRHAQTDLPADRQAALWQALAQSGVGQVLVRPLPQYRFEAFTAPDGRPAYRLRSTE